MIAVRNRLDEFDTDVDVVVVTFAQRQHVQDYLQRMSQLLSTSSARPLAFLIDEGRGAYRAYGLGRASTATIYGWRVWVRYCQILKSRGSDALQPPTEDTNQLGGDFVIDPSGTLIYARWSRGPADRPPVTHLVAATRRR